MPIPCPDCNTHHHPGFECVICKPTPKHPVYSKLLNCVHCGAFHLPDHPCECQDCSKIKTYVKPDSPDRQETDRPMTSEQVNNAIATISRVKQIPRTHAAELVFAYTFGLDF